MGGIVPDDCHLPTRQCLDVGSAACLARFDTAAVRLNLLDVDVMTDADADEELHEEGSDCQTLESLQR